MRTSERDFGLIKAESKKEKRRRLRLKECKPGKKLCNCSKICKP